MAGANRLLELGVIEQIGWVSKPWGLYGRRVSPEQSFAGKGEGDAPGGRHSVATMKLQEVRPSVFAVTLSAHELSTLLAGARMSLSFMETDPGSSTERSRRALESVLADFDRSLERMRRSGGE